MFREYDLMFGLFVAICIIIVVFLVVGYIYLYYNCMFISVSDLPGYCLSIL